MPLIVNPRLRRLVADLLLKFLWHSTSDSVFLRLRYLYAQHRLPDMNWPRSLTEKLTANKQLQATHLMREFADKFLARRLVAERIGDQVLIPLLGVYENTLELKDIRYLEPPYVLKATHGSGWNILMRERPSEKEFSDILSTVEKWLYSRYDIRGREDQYRTYRPRIIAERMLLDPAGKVPQDYKFYFFRNRCLQNGKCAMVCQIDIDRFGRHRRYFVDEDWKSSGLCILSKKATRADVPPPKPACWQEMVSVAQRLSEEFNFCRVDLYAFGDAVFFGEMTFHPESGYGLLIDPRATDEALGLLLPDYSNLFDRPQKPKAAGARGEMNA